MDKVRMFLALPFFLLCWLFWELTFRVGGDAFAEMFLEKAEPIIKERFGTKSR